jgi:hypothetical protein
MTTPPASRRRRGVSGIYRQLGSRGRSAVGNVAVPEGLIKSVRVAGAARRARAVVPGPADAAPVTSDSVLGQATSLQSMVMAGEAIAPSVRGPVLLPSPQDGRGVNALEQLAADRDEERW